MSAKNILKYNIYLTKFTHQCTHQSLETDGYLQKEWEIPTKASHVNNVAKSYMAI